MRQYELSPDANRDLDEIWSYVAGDNVDSADRSITRIVTSFADIAAPPYTPDGFVPN